MIQKIHDCNGESSILSLALVQAYFFYQNQSWVVEVLCQKEKKKSKNLKNQKMQKEVKQKPTAPSVPRGKSLLEL